MYLFLLVVLVDLLKLAPSSVLKKSVPGEGVFKIFCMGMLKVDFWISTVSIPQEAWFCEPSSYQIATNWVIFWPNFPSYTQPICKIGWANWVYWVWNRNPPIDIPNMTKKHPKAFEHPRISSTSQDPPPGKQSKLSTIRDLKGRCTSVSTWLHWIICILYTSFIHLSRLICQNKVIWHGLVLTSFMLKNQSICVSFYYIPHT